MSREAGTSLMSAAAFLAAFLWGLAWFALVHDADGPALFLGVLALALVVAKHAGDWILYALGVVAAVVLLL